MSRDTFAQLIRPDIIGATNNKKGRKAVLFYCTELQVGSYFFFLVAVLVAVFFVVPQAALDLHAMAILLFQKIYLKISHRKFRVKLIDKKCSMIRNAAGQHPLSFSLRSEGTGAHRTRNKSLFVMPYAPLQTVQMLSCRIFLIMD